MRTKVLQRGPVMEPCWGLGSENNSSTEHSAVTTNAQDTYIISQSIGNIKLDLNVKCSFLYHCKITAYGIENKLILILCYKFVHMAAWSSCRQFHWALFNDCSQFYCSYCSYYHSCSYQFIAFILILWCS